MWRVMVKVPSVWRDMMMGWLLLGGGTVSAQGIEKPVTLNANDSLLIKDLYFRGVQQRSSGKLAAAEKTFDRIVSMQPDNDAAHFELARIYFDHADYLAAERAALNAARIEPDNEWYWSMVLDIYRKTANVRAMPDIFDELIRLHPEKVDHYRDKAYAQYLDARYEAALATYDTIRAVFGETDDLHLMRHQVHLAKGDTSVAIGELERLVAKKPEESKGYILLAALYTHANESRKAIALLDEAMAAFPDEPLVLLGKSDTYLAMGKQRQAYGCLRQAFLSDGLDIDAKAGVLYAAVTNSKRPLAATHVTALADLLTEVYPMDAEAHAARGDIYVQLGQLEEARQAYLNAIDINQYIDGVWQQLLQVELQLGRYDEVETHGKDALALFPNHPLILFFTGHGFMGNKHYEKARTHLEASLNNTHDEHRPLLTQLYSSLGDVYHALGMHDESDVAYEEAIAIDSSNAYALNNYAYYLAIRKQELPLAAEMSKKSNEITPDYPSYQDTYAWVLFQQENYESALEWIEKAIGNSKVASETLLEHYGDILAKLGNIEGAIAQWKRAKNLAQSVGKDIDKLSRKIDAKQYIE